MLKAGDVLRAQVLHRRGAAPTGPDSAPVEALLRERVAQPATDARGGASGPVTRSFKVRLGPLDAPIDAGELEMMLAGLGEMGTVSNTVVDNVGGGSVAFDVLLEGAAADLESVLSLVVAPERIAVEVVQPAPEAVAAPEAVEPAKEAPRLHAVPPAAPTAAGEDEFFVDPAEFRRRSEAARPEPAPVEAKPQPQPQDDVDLFVSPEQFRKHRGSADAATAPVPVPAAPPEPAAAAAVPDPLAQAHDATFIRVATEKIDLLVNPVGELVITEAMLARSGSLGEADNDSRYAANSGLADPARHTRNLQEAVLAIRMLPISNVFNRFPRLVHELSARLGKRVELKLSGETTELDRGLIEKISDPLTHPVRNAIDHGLETPRERLDAGKPAAGTISLRASQRGGSILIEVTDDGRGLPRERILAAARRRGTVIADDAPDSEVWQLIFEAGFSTAEVVTDVSGRGVGMDVVKRNIQALSGTIDISSVAGQGTRVAVSVPLTLAIMEAMTVAVGGETYVLPLAGVVESLSVQPSDIHTLPGQGDTLRVREDFLPVLHMNRMFPPRQPREQPAGIAVIVESDDCRAALLVDELVGQQQVVVKSLETNFRRVPGLSGATVMGDGSVALIVDINGLVRMAGRTGALLF
ncbi:chemotaxis protein CheA [Ramlibacter terrae]|uniref:Chemotaxis protein CheA n=1 Tax=Ramlibacter terrae TaxID=2732511 RepID=A0ABX6P466_9BURK|nr:chemotaxis protein CheA [Ramlibacter terrae]